SICAGFTPDNRPRCIVYIRSIAAYRLTVAFHIPLLEVRSKPVQVLVVGEDGFGRGSKKISIPDANQREDNRNIFLERLMLKMVVHGMGTRQQFLEIIKSNGARY